MHGGIKIPITSIAKRHRARGGPMVDPDFDELNDFHDLLHRQAAEGRHVMRFAHHHDPTFDSGGTR